MSDKLSRAVGAGQPIEVDGKEYLLKPISMRHLKEVQSLALQYFKRQYIKTYAENADLLGEDSKNLLLRKMEEASRWDISDLPAKYVYDTSALSITPQLEQWLAEKYGELPGLVDEEQLGKNKLAVVGLALDSGELSKEEIKEMTGMVPMRVKVPYDAWWITATYEGMSTLVWASLGGLDGKITREEVQGWPFMKLHEAVRASELLTAPAVGNM